MKNVKLLLCVLIFMFALAFLGCSSLSDINDIIDVLKLQGWSTTNSPEDSYTHTHAQADKYVINEPNDSGGNEPNDSGGNEPNDSGGNEPNDSGGNKPNDSGGNKPNDSGGNKPNDSGD